MVGEQLAAVFAGGIGIVPHQPEAVHAGIRHTVHGLNIGGQIRLQTAGFGHVHLFRRNAGAGAGVHPALYEGGVILRGEHEKPFRLFHAFPAHAAQNPIFRDAFACGFIVAHGVAAPAVQQAVEAGTGAVRQPALLQQNGLDAAHAQVPQDARPCCAAADDDYCGFFHVASHAVPHEISYLKIFDEKILKTKR